MLNAQGQGSGLCKYKVFCSSYEWSGFGFRNLLFYFVFNFQVFKERKKRKKEGWTIQLTFTFSG